MLPPGVSYANLVCLSLLCQQLSALLLSTSSHFDNSSQSNNWVVLVAGSSGFSNYRHQADVAHAYHLLKNNGIPESNMIVMMYDDVANSPENPRKGTLFNDYSHKDYYAGLKIDYREQEVTPEMFMKVLKADPQLKAKGKKVLESDQNSNVFIFFTDHGAQGIIAFPSSELAADDLMRTLHFMDQQKRYKQLVLYIEACESGSMFKGLLPSNMRIYATTASNEVESSYACFCDDAVIHSCLGDCYSVNWMVDSEKHDLTKETLGDQYEDVRAQTTQSHVQQYGDKAMRTIPVDRFQGHSSHNLLSYPSMTKRPKLKDMKPARLADFVPPLKKMQKASTRQEWVDAERELQTVINNARLVKRTFDRIVDLVTGDNHLYKLAALIYHAKLSDMKCYKAAYKSYFDQCFKIQEYPEVASHLYKLNTLCFLGISEEEIISAIRKVCS